VTKQESAPASELTRRAVAAGVRVAEGQGVRCGGEGDGGGPVVLSDRSNVLVHLRPHALVARVATTTLGGRRGGKDWLARELAVAQFLTKGGGRVVPPADAIGPGPYEQDGFPITVWRYVAHAPEIPSDPFALTASLRDLHQVLGGYAGELPKLRVAFEEVGRGVEALGRWGTLPEDDVAFLRGAVSRFLAHLDAEPVLVPIHGDAHAANTFATEAGLVWGDFEDVCSGPVTWDLACLLRRHGTDALAAYGGGVEPEDLAPYFAARDLQLVVWSWFFTRRVPEYKELAASRLATFRASF
jgi:hypothetical protein